MRQVGRLRGVAARARRARDAARPARADAPRRRAAWLVALVLAIMVCPRIARAEVIKTPSWGTVEGFVHYVAYPYDTADEAAMATLGYEWNTFSTYRRAQISQLAAWRAYADKFHNVASDFSAIGVYEWILQYFSGDKVWIVDTGQEFYDQAQKVVKAALSVDGGKDENTELGGFYTITFVPFDASLYSFSSNPNNPTYASGNFLCYKLGSTNYVPKRYVNANANRFQAVNYKWSMSSSAYNKLIGLKNTFNWDDIYILIQNYYSTNRNEWQLSYYAMDKEPKRWVDDNGNFVAWYLDSGHYCSGINFSASNYVAVNNVTWPANLSELSNAVKISPLYFQHGSETTITSRQYFTNTYLVSSALIHNGTSITEPPNPDVPDPPVTKPTQPEPQDPVAPSPPELPNPVETPVPDPPDPIQTPTYNPDPTGTNQDYTPWLDEIIRLLRMINTSLVTLTNEMISAVNTAYDAVVDAIYSHQMEMRQLITWLNTQLQEGMDGVIEQLNDYLYHTMGWFEDDLQIMLDEIKDDIIQQLKLIRMKIGQKGGTSEPVSGPDDPNWWDWLTRMFSEWLSDLFEIPADKKGALDAAFDALKECFPFSIPWDLVTILGLLAHEPVVPVADLPLPVPEIVDASGMIEVHIDLTPYEGVATVIRAMTLIGFAVGLAMMSHEWFSTIKMGDM